MRRVVLRTLRKFRSESWIVKNNCQTIVSVIWEHRNLGDCVRIWCDRRILFSADNSFPPHHNAPHRFRCFHKLPFKIHYKKMFATRRAASHRIGVNRLLRGRPEHNLRMSECSTDHCWKQWHTTDTLCPTYAVVRRHIHRTSRRPTVRPRSNGWNCSVVVRIHQRGMVVP